MSRKFKLDNNHKPIIDYLRLFVAVIDTAHAGKGIVDGMAWIKDGWQLFDIKNPDTAYGRNGLNERQKKRNGDYRGGPIYLIYTTQDADNFRLGRFYKLKSEPAGGTPMEQDT